MIPPKFPLLLELAIILMSKVHFWPSNSCLGLVLAIELQNRVSLTTELLKPFTFGHPAVLVAGFTDVDAAWQWGPLVSVTTPLSSLYLPLSLSYLISFLLSPSCSPAEAMARRPRSSAGSNSSLSLSSSCPATQFRPQPAAPPSPPSPSVAARSGRARM